MLLNDSFVSASDYGFGSNPGDTGFGNGAMVNPQMVQDLAKALATNGSAGTDGSALIPQSLESTLKVTTHKMEELKFWRMLAKRPAYNTVEEYNVLGSYGSDENGFIQEGALPNSDASDYTRQVGLVKFMGTVRSVTHPATLVRTMVGDMIDLEDANGTMQLLTNLEKGLFYGDDRLNPLAFRGFKQLLQLSAPQNIIDMRGQPINGQALEDIDRRVADSFGAIDVLFMSTRAKANCSKLLLADAAKYTFLPQQGAKTNLGMVVEEFQGNNSSFKLENHKFIRERTLPKTSLPRNLSGKTLAAPSAPTTAVSAPVTASRLDAGTYYYSVAAVNNVAEGLASAVSTGAVASVGNTVQVTWNQVAGALFYRIYRNRVGDTTLQPYLVAEVPDSGSLTTQWVDQGYFIPGCSMAFGIYTDGDQGLAFKQLAPLMKMPLAQVDTSMRWAILLYGMLQMYQPKKQILLINVGDGSVIQTAASGPDVALTNYFAGGGM